MTITFNHTIIAAKNRLESAHFYRELLEARDVASWGPFSNLQLDDGVLLQFAEPPFDVPPIHYAFLVDEEHFDRVYDRIVRRRLDHWADPQRTLAGQVNSEHGGRGVYFLDPSGNYLEIITRPYI